VLEYQLKGLLYDLRSVLVRILHPGLAKLLSERGNHLWLALFRSLLVEHRVGSSLRDNIVWVLQCSEKN
jgi:hypothetical protein